MLETVNGFAGNLKIGARFDLCVYLIKAAPNKSYEFYHLFRIIQFFLSLKYKPHLSRRLCTDLHTNHLSLYSKNNIFNDYIYTFIVTNMLYQRVAYKNSFAKLFTFELKTRSVFRNNYGVPFRIFLGNYIFIKCIIVLICTWKKHKQLQTKGL